MTEQFDEGVKEIVMTLLSLGATAYETDYILDLLDKQPEPIEQKIQAVKVADDQIVSSEFDEVAAEVIQSLEQEEPQAEPRAPAQEPEDPGELVKGKLNTEYYVFNKLKEHGLSSIAAVGIVANLKAESKLDPTTKQIWKYKPTIKYGPGRGLAQWERGGRFDTDRINLVKFAKKQGTDWTDLDTQIDFIAYEMAVHPEYKRVKAMLNKAKTPEEATNIFLKKYEKAGIPHAEKRLEYAKVIADKYLNI